MLILLAALSTCDPGNVMDAVKAAKEKNVHVSIVGMAAEVRICSVFTKVVALTLLSTVLIVPVFVGRAHHSWAHGQTIEPSSQRPFHDSSVLHDLSERCGIPLACCCKSGC